MGSSSRRAGRARAVSYVGCPAAATSGTERRSYLGLGTAGVTSYICTRSFLGSSRGAALWPGTSGPLVGSPCRAGALVGVAAAADCNA